MKFNDRDTKCLKRQTGATMMKISNQSMIILVNIFFAWCLLGAEQAFSQQTSAQSSADDRDANTGDRRDSDELAETDDMPLFVSDSNTGYIDNAIIGTRFRVRIDGGFGVDAPDRAEFFYGACGCARVVPNPPSNVPNANGDVLNPDAPGPRLSGNSIGLRICVEQKLFAIRGSTGALRRWGMAR